MKVEVRSLTKIYGEKDRNVVAIEDVNFNVAEGEFVCILGPTGCGKTTLLRIIAGLERPTSGEVLLDGSPVCEPRKDCLLYTSPSPRDRTRSRMPSSA